MNRIDSVFLSYYSFIIYFYSQGSILLLSFLSLILLIYFLFLLDLKKEVYGSVDTDEAIKIYEWISEIFLFYNSLPFS